MNRLSPIFGSFALLPGLLLPSSQAFAAAPETLTYAGKLARDGEAFDQLDVSERRFIVDLGATNPIADKLDGSKYWLEVVVNGQPLSPRSSVGSVPYALEAGQCKNRRGRASAR
jgi:hypothetical protein